MAGRLEGKSCGDHGLGSRHRLGLRGSDGERRGPRSSSMTLWIAKSPLRPSVIPGRRRLGFRRTLRTSGRWKKRSKGRSMCSEAWTFWSTMPPSLPVSSGGRSLTFPWTNGIRSFTSISREPSFPSVRFAQQMKKQGSGKIVNISSAVVATGISELCPLHDLEISGHRDDPCDGPRAGPSPASASMP